MSNPETPMDSDSAARQQQVDRFSRDLSWSGGQRQASEDAQALVMQWREKVVAEVWGVNLPLVGRLIPELPRLTPPSNMTGQTPGSC